MDLNAIREKRVRFAIGMMSGTSCDGVDAGLVRIKGTGANLLLKFIEFTTSAYPPDVRKRLLDPHLSAQDLCLLSFELGEQFAGAATEMLKVARNNGVEVDFIASSGHTIVHAPPGAGPKVGTLQIGEPAVIAERTGLPIVSDFRTRDLAAGGQGAPLVPYADWVLFSRPDRTVVCLNLGGIANFTVVTPDFEGVSAFDSGPGNMAIDGAVGLLTRGAQQMDEDGAAAAKGNVIDELLEYLLSHPYFERVPPKSTGREEFGPEVYLRDALANRKEYSLEDLVATVTTAVGYSIVRAFNRFIKPYHDVARIIVSGGGAHNRTLRLTIEQGLAGIAVRTSGTYGIPSNAKEAVAFAILGNEALCGTPANVPQATGARHPVILGKITPG